MSFKESVLANYEPSVVWERFYEITQVPRPSKKEEKIREHLRNLCKNNSLDFSEDTVGNIIIRIPATKGYESSPISVLQGHVDMVCEKNKEIVHDFDNDPIKLRIDGDYLKATGTTLGADNGIGVAAALALAFDKNVEHGPLELLFTIDEETGLTGANALSSDFVKGKILLNLDSEEHGTFFVGCAGGQDTKGVYDIKATELPAGFSAYELMVSGLKGGHSGLDIKNGLANAIKILGRVLKKLENVEYYLADISGGSKHNAIPREAEAKLFIKSSDEEKVSTLINECVTEALMEYKKNDGGLKVTLAKVDYSGKVYDKDFTSKIVNVIFAMPHGVISMSPDIEGLVETSTNLATVVTDGSKLTIGTSQRSSVEPAKIAVYNAVKSVLELSGAEVLTGDGYPAWQPNMESKILKVAKECYKKLEGTEPKIEAIHAGLECGIIGDKYDGMDMISFGPTMHSVHSPDEKLNIPSVSEFYNLLKEILKTIAENK